MPKKQEIHLGLLSSVTGSHWASWRYPSSHPEQGTDLDYYKKIALSAEAGKFDFIFLADGLAAYEGDVASADVGDAGQHAAAAEYLDLEALARCAELQQVVDEAFHCVGAIAGGEAYSRIEPIVGPGGGVLAGGGRAPDRPVAVTHEPRAGGRSRRLDPRRP